VGVTVSRDLIRRAQTGDRQALVRLVEAYQGPVYSLALAVMRDPADAADMTQETFVRLLRSLASYRGDGQSFTSWVHRMTINICLDSLRRRQRSRDLAGQPHGERVLEPASSDLWEQPEWRAESSESVHEVRAALRALPPPQRQALTLHYLEDRPYGEIAACMGVPLNTVKSHILRGKERMARLLDPARVRGGRRFGLAAASERGRKPVLMMAIAAAFPSQVGHQTFGRLRLGRTAACPPNFW
jgi:RNA polymerase sigma-70 factor (ECF subfamily)